MTQTDPHRSLSRALDILELCSSSPGGYTLSQLSVRLSISKGSISPLLHTLRQRGYLLLDGTTRCYRIGSMAFHVGNSYLDGSNLMEEIRMIFCGQARAQAPQAMQAASSTSATPFGGRWMAPNLQAETQAPHPRQPKAHPGFSPAAGQLPLQATTAAL